jgi:phosphate transport system protein
VTALMDARHIDEELDVLKSRLMAMGALAEQRMCAAVDALVLADREKLREVLHGDPAINELQMDVDDRCFRLIALQHPVAVDLRFIVSATKVTVDLERIGDQAVNIAEAADRYLDRKPIKQLIDLPRMSTVAQGMLVTALEAFLNENSALASSVLAMDDRLDGLKEQVFRELLTYMLGDRMTIEPGIDLILIARHLERIGDHATNIAEHAIFLADARDVRHGSRTIPYE